MPAKLSHGQSRLSALNPEDPAPVIHLGDHTDHIIRCDDPCILIQIVIAPGPVTLRIQSDYTMNHIPITLPVNDHIPTLD